MSGGTYSVCVWFRLLVKEKGGGVGCLYFYQFNGGVGVEGERRGCHLLRLEFKGNWKEGVEKSPSSENILEKNLSSEKLTKNDIRVLERTFYMNSLD